MALDRYESSLCPLCGLPTRICQNPANEGLFDAEDPTRCHASTALILRQERYGEDAPQREALLWERPTLRAADPG